MLRAATGLVLNELIDRLGGANRLALPPMAWAPNAPFNLAGGVLNVFVELHPCETARYRNPYAANAVMTECLHLRELCDPTAAETAFLEVSWPRKIQKPS